MQQSEQTLYTSIKLLDNKSILKKLGILQIVLFFVFYILNSILFFFLHLPINSSVNLSTFFQGIVGVIIGGFFILIIHELIHGLFFWLFSRKKVKFGFKQGLAYATCPGFLFSKKQFFITLSSPFIVITAILLMLQYSLFHPMVILFLISWHASACAGDFYMIKIIIKAPANILIEDTESGIDLWYK